MRLRRERLASLFVCLALTLGTRASIAQWIPDGAAVCTASGNQYYPAIASDGSGGAIISWSDFRNGTDLDIFAQRLNASGVPQWAADGVALSAAADEQSEPAMVSDGSGGAIIAWRDNRNGGNRNIYAQRVNAAGVPLWTPDGVALSSDLVEQFWCIPNAGCPPTIVSDGAGGAIVTWYDNHIRAQRVNSAGVVQWTTSGIGLSTAAAGFQFNPAIVADGTGGAIVAWQDSRDFVQFNIYAQHVNAAGTLQWAASGLPLCTDPNDQNTATITTDGSGGAIVGWSDGRNGGANHDIYAQRVNGAGAVQWTLDGVAISNAGSNQDNPKIVSDGSAGAIIAWPDGRGGDRDIYAQRVSSSGIVQWTTDGVAVSTAANSQDSPNIAADGSGGAIVTWHDGRSLNSDIYSQRVDAAGVAQWTANGVAICTNGYDQLNPTISSDGSGAAIITWYDSRSQSSYDLYAQRVLGSGGIAAVSSRQPEQFAVYDPRPNPARAGTTLVFDLKGPQRVSLGVYDVSGQLVRTLAEHREYSAGRQTMAWDATSDAHAPVSAGVYFIRVTNEGASVARRVLIIR